MSVCLGIDTSNYTTSVALFDGETGHNLGRLLEVRSGELGLRQSDALFQHVKRLPELFGQLRQEGRLCDIAAVGTSIKPRWVEGSYMPCFLAGESVGRVLADTLGVPFFACAHQQGHVAAAAWSAGRSDLLDQPHLAWHLSGGTTELVYVEPRESTICCEKIGGTNDLSAGQLIDRTGKYLGLDFPAGKALDALACQCEEMGGWPIKVNGLTFSLSGMENQVMDLVGKDGPPEAVARLVLETLIKAVSKVTVAAERMEPYHHLPVLFSGGVASNSILRGRLRDMGAFFAKPEYSTDNALGVAILAHRALMRGEGR